MKDKIKTELKNMPHSVEGGDEKGDNQIVIAHGDLDLPSEIKAPGDIFSTSGWYCTPIKTEEIVTQMRSDFFNSLRLHSIQRTKKALLWKRTAVGILLRWRLFQAQSAFSCSGLAGKLYKDQSLAKAGENMYVDPVRFNFSHTPNDIIQTLSLPGEFCQFVSTNTPTKLLGQADKMQDFKLSLQNLNSIVQYMMNDLISSESNSSLMQYASDVNLLKLNGLRWQSFEVTNSMKKSDQWKKFINEVDPIPVKTYSTGESSKERSYMYMNPSQVYDAVYKKKGIAEVPDKTTYFEDSHQLNFKPTETNARDYLYRFSRSDLSFLSCRDMGSFIDAVRFDDKDDSELLAMGISTTQCDI